MMARLCSIHEHENYLVACCKHSCHETYYPYFYNNSHCKHLFDELRKNSLGTAQVPDLFENELFGNKKCAGSYKEDDWTIDRKAT